VLIPETEQGASLTDPSISPDGMRIAYARVPRLRRVQGALDTSSDLWVANRDGTGARMVYERTGLAQLASEPQWVDDSTLLFILRTFVDPAVPAAGANYAIVRLDIETGATTRMVEQALHFDVSPDRTKIAYLLLEGPEETPLYIAEIDGSAPVRRLDLATSGLDGYSGLAYTPDGTSLLIGAHIESEGQEDEGASGRPPGRASFVSLHSAPVDLWTLPVAEGEARQVAELELENVHLAAGPDGRAFALAGKLFDIDTTTGEVVELEDPQRFGGVAFADD
jgi:Tol biopolymer transport system component